MLTEGRASKLKPCEQISRSCSLQEQIAEVKRGAQESVTLPASGKNVHCFHFHCSFNFFLYINLFILFIYFWLRWVFVAGRGLSLVAASGGCSSLPCTGFSLWWLLLLWSTGSRRAGFSGCGSRALERRLSSCGARA